MRRQLTLTSTALIGTALAAALGGGRPQEPVYTSEFGLEDCPTVLPISSNPYFPLNPGHFLRLEGRDNGEFVELEITVLAAIQPVEFELDENRITAMTRVVEEREWINGELVEVSRNYFAQCARTGNIFYFGEDVDIYKGGKVVSHAGAWLAGDDGAEPGIIMPGLFLLGSRYFQEIAPGVALDRAEHVDMDMEIDTPAGRFEDCVMVLETTPLEPGAENFKIYAPGIGLIVSDSLELVAYR